MASHMIYCRIHCFVEASSWISSSYTTRQNLFAFISWVIDWPVFIRSASWVILCHGLILWSQAGYCSYFCGCFPINFFQILIHEVLVSVQVSQVYIDISKDFPWIHYLWMNGACLGLLYAEIVLIVIHLRLFKSQCLINVIIPELWNSCFLLIWLSSGCHTILKL